ncbi:MAG: hypothetical protein KDC38_02270 [Planctomycetes bacterium]|nr:hypothetical protein [Planctomycetota bacterium]
MRLNKRETRLLGITLAVVLLTVASLLLRRGDSEGDAMVAEATESSAPADPLARATPKVPAATPPPENPPGNSLGALVATLDLQTQIDRVARPRSRLVVRDPFREVAVIDAPKAVADRDDLPFVTALFYSSSRDRAAVLDGELVFLGETIRDFRLIEVLGDGVVVESGGQVYRLIFDPLLSGAKNEGTQR